MASESAKQFAKNIMQKYSFYVAESDEAPKEEDNVQMNNYNNQIIRPTESNKNELVKNTSFDAISINSDKLSYKNTSCNENSIKTVSQISQQCRFYPTLCTEFTLKNHAKYEDILTKPIVDIRLLKQQAWNGVPSCCRLLVWQILSGILTVTVSEHETILKQKRSEYQGYVNSYFEHRNTGTNSTIFRQICLDIPRTFPLISLFQNSTVQKMYERILYIWSVRHPASGYVQGINDLLSPFLLSALHKHLGNDILADDVSLLQIDILQNIESETFWLLTKLLDTIINNYTPDQPGIQTKLRKVKSLVQMSNINTYNKLISLSFEDGLFCFKWINNLFIRDLPFKCAIRLWDTFWAQEGGFENFIVYICGAIFKIFSKDIMKIDENSGLIMLLQSLPTSDWNEEDVLMLLAEAYILHDQYSAYINKVK